MSNPRLYASASKNPPKDILACSLTVIMEKKDFEEKRAQYNALWSRYKELMDQCNAIEKVCSAMIGELGYSSVPIRQHFYEFDDLLGPAGFRIATVDKVETVGPPDVYLLRVERRFPQFPICHSGDNSGDNSPGACLGESRC